ncbi:MULTISPECIES: type I-E CRISPR-associated protein Cas7/Cse4/CasC [Mycolicibacter]|uniref:Type I-E CRISPR-associated protein Cas7/Cse4/CasC n=2 Tax=Mycolicibacter TaxID=1073531 RepID=A0ABU5XMJ1_9MYCO|nr:MULTISPECIES: type I-E CRISPR-associated protein Cas7/Cse4/CasC [unclassified Mycolicibacter]MEB3023398.1 type I-E CRISPR-associated protein Cas7/Cse4/CasC [Mycolicibacter sp. MYC098]MEB3033740.1 type I-E CRISPR-associated protein Cas7/Cse4/CasC [Mycolicibacter sp. MYC340]
MIDLNGNAPFVTLHALQAFPPSLLNRDDSNAAKQIVVGGTPRVRVSSASGKRAIRTAMRAHRIDGAEYGLRTNRFPALTAEVLTDSYGRAADVAAAKTAAVFRKLNLKATDKGDTAVLIFGNESLPQTMAAVINQAWDEIGDDAPADTIAAAAAALDGGRAVDLALFGRMLAEIPTGRIDGAVGVAHSFSVDAAAIEPDFWTAIDDAAPAGEPVSSNLGEAMVSAPILYRSASLDRRQLRRNLAGASEDADALARAAEQSFIEWFIRAVPSAKQRASVAATLPSVVAATLSTQVLSAANAFTTPITGPDVLGAATSALLSTLDRGTDVIGEGENVILAIDPAADHLVNGHTSASTIAEFTATISAR